MATGFAEPTVSVQPDPLALPELSLDQDEIQGNVIPGFLKPHQGLISLLIGDDAEPDQVKPWLANLLSKLTTLARAMDSRVKVREYRKQLDFAGLTSVLNPVPNEVDDLWLNLAISYAGMVKLVGDDATRRAEVEQFEDEAFKCGLAARSALLGDPIDSNDKGNPANWVVGGPKKEADLLLILAADDEQSLVSLAAELSDGAASAGLTVLQTDIGHKLRGDTEHFGFKDGVSQPGPRGRYAPDPDNPGRTLPITYRAVDPNDLPEAGMYGRPGQYLVWPGEFIFGYAGQGVDPMLPSAVRLPGPKWSRNGSYVVYRRLRQDVHGFREFLRTEAARISQKPGFADLTEDRLGALLVGRWPSGAPVARTPAEDDTDLGANRNANDYFEFSHQPRRLSLQEGEKGDQFPQAGPDPIGMVCPLGAHIRKVNTRQAANDEGGRRASFNRRLLRRGLPYGEPLNTAADGDDGVDRGLLFVSYQTSITRQFEFLNSQWMGDPTNPRSPSGHDMLVGQNGQPGQGRARQCLLLGTSGATAEVKTSQDFVIPTGGGYFFSPSLSALELLLM